MKCVQCGAENNLKGFTMNLWDYQWCRHCGHRWTFNPDRMGRIKFIDSFFVDVIRKVSAEGTLFFTRKQLAYSLDRQLKEKDNSTGFGWLFFYIFITIWASGFWGIFLFLAIGNASIITVFFLMSLLFMGYFAYGCQSSRLSYKVRYANARNLQIIGVLVIAVGVSVYAYLFDSPAILAFSLLLGILSIGVGIWQKQRQAKIGEKLLFRASSFEAWLTRWTQINGAIANLLPLPFEERDKVNLDPNPDYWNGVLICDHDAIAQFLIANGFCEQNQCAVISISGYPQSVFNRIQPMLRQNPNLPIYVLHNASPSGVSLIAQLREHEEWFQNQDVKIYDLGLRPRQVWKSRNSVIHCSKNSASQAANLFPILQGELAANELAWLKLGFFVELESFPPEKLLQVVTQKIAKREVFVEGDEDFLGNLKPSVNPRKSLSLPFS